MNALERMLSKGFLGKIFRHTTAQLFIRYFIFAALATAVDFAVLYSLTDLFHVYYLLSAAIAYACGMVTNYAFNRRYTFKSTHRKIARQFSVFVFVALIGLGLNELIIYLLVEYAHLWYMFAKVASVCIVLFWSFNGHRHITFRGSA